MTSLATEQSPSDGRRTQVFRLAKRKYAIGLLWLTAEATEGVDKEARRQAKDRLANLYLIRTIEGAAQFGLGRKNEGLQSGCVSAAAAISQKLKGSLCGVFQVADGYWFFSQREDLITPEGDCFYDDETQARARLQAAVDEGGWSHVYAPSAWNMGETLDIAEILMLAKGPRIKTVNPLAGYTIPIVLVMVLAGGAFFGFTKYQQYQAEQEEADFLAREKVRIDLENANKKPEPIVSPWPEFALASAVIASCDAGMDKIQPDTPGWAMTGWSCQLRGKTGTGYSWEWTRMFGTTVWLETWLNDHYSPETAAATSFATDGDHASTSLNGDSLAPRGAQTLLTEQRLIVDLNSAAQAVGSVAKLGKIRLPQPPEGTKAEDWTPPAFGSISWSMNVVTLNDWAAALDRVPGLIVQEVKYDPNSNGFTLNGDVYVQR